MKHACLILAHTDFAQLKRLVSEIDDERNHIYVHFDAKVKTIPDITTEKAELTILSNRIDVRWGDFSVVEAEYALFEAAVQDGPYSRYHLLSGADLPLRSQDEIHAFFDAHPEKEFIGYTLTDITPEIVRKAMRWHLFPKDFRTAPRWKKIARAGFIRAQELFGIKRNRNVAFKKGSQWVSITDAMARRFLDSRDWATKTFSHTFCPDEIVMQTLCWNSDLLRNVWDTKDDAKGCLRAISWRNGEMISWREEDLPALKETGAMFARKFISGR